MSYAADDFVTVEFDLGADFEVNFAPIDADFDIGDVLPFTPLCDADDVAHFDASDFMSPDAGTVVGLLSNDDLLEIWFAQQIESSSVIRARRKSAAVANDAQLQLFA
jgi:hypothetical protein